MAATASMSVAGERLKLARLLVRRKTALIGLIILVVLVLAAAFAPYITGYTPQKLSIVNRLKPPSGAHWFGTDEFGRDVFTRAVYG